LTISLAERDSTLKNEEILINLNSLMWPKIESGKIIHGENGGENYLVNKLRPD